MADEQSRFALDRNPVDRRRFLGALAGTTAVVVFGGIKYVVADVEKAERLAKAKRPDGKPRVPPNQYVLERLRPMGGTEGDASPGKFRLRVHGEVESPFEIDFAELLEMPQQDQVCDVHCVTKWTVIDSRWQGVRVSDLAARAKPKSGARFVVFEAASGYTSNVDLAEAMKPEVLVAHRLEGEPLMRRNGAPVRALVPDRYFWKSAKWLTGIRFVDKDEPGYWELRGYNNHADPWREERYG
jgi:DMSO/TMAO reductase YedYZ molybdopterin-dependent catalytic subunit